MLVGDQVIWWNVFFQNDQLSCREQNNCHMSQFPNGALCSMRFRRELRRHRCQGTQVARRPAKDRLLLTPRTRNVRRSDPTGGCKTLMEWHPAVFLYYRSLSRSDTEKDTVHLLHRNTEKHDHRKVQNFVENHMKKEKCPPPKKHPFQRNLTEILFGSFCYPHIHLTSADPLCFWKLHRLVVSHLLHLFHLTLEKRMSNSSHGFVEKLDRNLFETWAYG